MKQIQAYQDVSFTQFVWTMSVQLRSLQCELIYHFVKRRSLASQLYIASYSYIYVSPYIHTVKLKVYIYPKIGLISHNSDDPKFWLYNSQLLYNQNFELSELCNQPVIQVAVTVIFNGCQYTNELYSSLIYQQPLNTTVTATCISSQLHYNMAMFNCL